MAFPNDLSKRNPGGQTSLQLSSEVRQQLLSYIDSTLLAKYLKQRNWSLNEEISTLVTLAREGLSEAIRLRAVEALARRVDLALAREGLLVKATRTIKSLKTPTDSADTLTFSTELVAHSLSEQLEETQPTILGDNQDGTDRNETDRNETENNQDDGEGNTLR